MQEAAEAEAEANKDKEPEMDYLSPFLAQIGAPAKLESSQAYRLKEDCLSDLKQRLIDKANLIQLRFEKVREACSTVFFIDAASVLKWLKENALL
ncbi:MAG: hypothetical protein AAFO91_13965 [Bacteroidota bacterium]